MMALKPFGPLRPRFFFAPLFALLAGCDARRFPASTFAPRSDLAHWVQNVYLEVITWDSLILILICVLVLPVPDPLFDPRAGPTSPGRPRRTSNRWGWKWRGPSVPR